jgi:hypothetical protein
MVESNGALTNPQLVPLLGAVLLALSFEALTRGRVAAAVACGAALGLFADAHTLAVPALVTVPIAILALGARPAHGLVVAGVAAVTLLALSFGAHAHNLSILVRGGHAPAVVLGIAAAVGAAAFARRFTRSMDAAVRCAVATVWLFATSAWLPIVMLLARGSTWGSRYWGPAVSTCGPVAAMALQLAAIPARTARVVVIADVALGAAFLVALALGRLPL